MALTFLHRIGRPRQALRDQWLVQQAGGRAVLHLGCVDQGLLEERIRSGELLHARLAATSGVLVGVDLDAEGISHLNELGVGQNFVADVEHLESHPELANRAFEVVIAGEIIEHVSNVGRFLESCRQVLAPGGVLLITTPNAARPQNAWFAMLGLELVHPDHLSWFSTVTLLEAVRRAGLEPVELLMYHLPDQFPTSRGRTLPRYLLQVLFFGIRLFLVRPLVLISPLLADGLILTARAPAPRPAS